MAKIDEINTVNNNHCNCCGENTLEVYTKIKIM